MIKRTFHLFILLFVVCSFSFLFTYSVKADETMTINQIKITQYPTKLIYARGENLDLTGMIVTGFHSDGTSDSIADYQTSSFDSNLIGSQTITVSYLTYSDTFSITVIPAMVTNITAASHSTTDLTLSWNALPDITAYEVYCLDDATGNYNLAATVGTNTVTFNYLSGTVHSYRICAIMNINGIKYTSAFSDQFTAATNPDQVSGLTVVKTTDNSVELSWNSVERTTGYRIYRYDYSDSSYHYIDYTTATTYISKNLKSGTNFKYKVYAYAYSKTFLGKGSLEVIISTNPSAVVLRCKAGDQKVRFTWPIVTGATSYDIYMGNDITGYTLLTTNEGNSNCSFVAEGLATGTAYTFYAIAHRKVGGVVYDSVNSVKKEVTIDAVKDTSIIAKYFPSQTDFKASSAYKCITDFKKNVIYSKSVVIPGLITTNVDGFISSSMCPQGITFAGDYLLMTAYDIASEENSVIYVIDKTSKKYIKTLILPNKAHVGGISYDGTDVWVTVGSKVDSIPFSQILTAINEGGISSEINFSTFNSLGYTASFITYYQGKLWLGTYDELKSTYMYSYQIDNTNTVPVLTKEDKVIMPTRVQGISFTGKGELILSRSCQLYEGLRGYMRRIDVYQPTFTGDINKTTPLGECKNYVYMPSMNEGIALYGSYLYVNFESGAFPTASYKMDRICAFTLSSVLKKASYSTDTVK